MGALYQITFPNGKAYIGITSGTAERRYAKHVTASRRAGARFHLVHRAIRKYAGQAVVKTLVVADDMAYLRDLEVRAIAALGTKRPHGYNLTNGGEGITGFRFSEESRAKMSAAGRARPPISEETRAKLRAATAGHKRSIGMRHCDEAKARKSLQQLLRTSPAKNSTSGVRGVNWHKKAGKWQARFKVKKVVHHIGLFEDRQAAIAARSAALSAYLERGVTP